MNWLEITTALWLACVCALWIFIKGATDDEDHE